MRAVLPFLVLLFVALLAGCNAPAVHPGSDPGFGPPVAEAQAPVRRRPERVGPAPQRPGPERVGPPPAPPAHVPVPQHYGDHGDWNDGEIAWRTYDDGVAEARRSHKPVLLVLYATWCGHCANYSHVFQSDDVVHAAHDFVMVRVDSDREPAVASRFAPDGAYVPRTFFLSPNGDLVASVKAHEGRYQYFFDESNPESLLAAMRSARTATL